MKGSWPKVSASWTKEVRIKHSLPHLGNPEPHHHVFYISIGWSREINPRFGYTHPLKKCEEMLDKLTCRLTAYSLDELLPTGLPGTAENLAVWLLVRCQGLVDWVEIGAYRDYVVRVEADGLRSEMREAYLNGEQPLDLTV